ncbi:MAG: PAS domain S-box protein [Thermoguttaceae bacterium]
MIISKHWRSLLIRYGTAVVATLLATLLRKLLDPILENTAPFSAYYAAVMFTAWYGGLGPSLVALVSGAVLADRLFIEPHLSLFASNLEHQVGLGLYVAVGVVVALLCESLHASRRRIELAHEQLAEANRGLQKEIAERQQAERWLLESEQRFRGYFEQGLVGMAMLSAERGWIEVNQRACQMLGYSETELLSKTWADLVHPDDLPGEEGHFKQMLGGVVQGYVTDQRFLRKDGKILYAGLSVQCMRKPDGAVDCILVLAQDISTFPKRDEITSAANTTAQITA